MINAKLRVIPFFLYLYTKKNVCTISCFYFLNEAKCRRHPPEAANATTNSINGTHGEMAAYECKHPFQKVRQETMVCNFGQWEGLLPVCKNRNCIVHQINYGTFMEQVWTERFSFRSFKNERSITYQKIQIDSERAENSSAYVTCASGYSFQGHGSYYNAVKCIHGDWSPHPICLPSGTFYKEKNQSTSVEPSTEKPKVSAPSIKTSTNRSQTTRLRSVLRTSRIPKSRPTQKPYLPATSSNKSCTCRYFSHDEHLVAYVGTKRLLPISEIDNNFKVKFFCEPFGYLELMGPSEITCQDCQWNSTIYPKCASPKTGETTLHINGDWQLLPGGIVGMKKGKILSISCEANGTGFVPQWNYSAAPRIHVENYLNYYSGRNASMLYIFQMDTIHEGKYQCFVPGYAPKIIEIQLLADLASVTCPKLEQDDLIIRYRRGQTVDSLALISCKQRHKVLVGRNRLRCLPSGQWSSHIRSRCEDVPGCIPPLKSTDSKLFIEPNKQFYRYGETVLLSCPVGTILSSEVVRIFCQRTGWSQKDLPECIDR